MVFKKVFGRKKKAVTEESSRELTAEDLVTLERYEEALEMLKQRVKLVPNDLYAHLKMAEVYVALREIPKALDEFTFVADSYADDGFFDKGIALLSKATRLVPGDDMLPRRIEKYRNLKRLEKVRQFAVNGLLANKSTGVTTAGNSKLQVELLWNKIAKSHLVLKLEGAVLQKLFSVMEMVNTKTGQVLADAGSSFPALFVVVSGVIEAEADINGKTLAVRTFTTGDLIGDSALLERKTWPAKYTVTEQGTLFKLNRDGLEKVMAGNSDPVGFLSVLREQHNDRDIAVAIQKLYA